MKNVYFIGNIDENHQTILHSGSGASEFLFYLTAKHLSQHFHVTIINRFSHDPVSLDNIEYLFLYDDKQKVMKEIKDSVIVVQRDFDLLIELHKINPFNKYILWCHDFLYDSPCRSRINNYYHENNISVISVSHFHRKNIMSLMPNVKIFLIYNALFEDNYKKNEKIEYNKNSIIFASNWYKGLDRVLNIGERYYSKKNRNFRLVLIKPSYCTWEPDLQKYPFVEILGTIKNRDEYSMLLQKHLCMFTTSYPETFGCTFAEALHLGLPVIGDRSVVSGYHEIIEKEYLCNFTRIGKVIKKIEELRDNRPHVTLNEKFYGTSVIQKWIKIINKV